MLFDTLNPFTSTGAKPVPNFDPLVYHAMNKGVKRGDPKFIMSSHELARFYACPRKWIDTMTEEDFSGRVWGNGIDCLVLTPDRFDSLFAIRPATYYNEKTGKDVPWSGNSNACKQWLAEHKDKMVIPERLPEPEDGEPEVRKGALSPSLHELKLAVSRLREDKRICELLDCSEKQVYVTVEYRDRDTGLTINFKCLIDLVPSRDHKMFGKSLADLKTSRYAGMWAWRQDVKKFGYHVQAATYIDAYHMATGDERIEFRHAIQENVDPFVTARRLLSGDHIELGRFIYVNALKFYARCLKNQFWPDYDDMSETLDGWQLVALDPGMISRLTVPTMPEEKLAKEVGQTQDVYEDLVP